MELKTSNVITAFILFSVLVALFGQFYAGIKQEYGFVETFADDEGSPITKLQNIQVINGIDDIVAGAYEISSPTASLFDIVGGLTAAGIGFLKTATGVITFPIEIIGIITGFYTIPSEVATAFGVIFILYMMFVLIKNYTKENN